MNGSFMNCDGIPAEDGKRSLIAVVDDEPEVCKALRRLLRAVGFDVNTFRSGQDFLENLHVQPPDCLILDLHLPGLTGLDVQHHLRATGATIPVIVITGRDEPGLAERVSGAGASAFLLKPVNDVELLGTVHELLARSSAARQE
jgi:FixJ family two-component response regulator